MLEPSLTVIPFLLKSNASKTYNRVSEARRLDQYVFYHDDSTTHTRPKLRKCGWKVLVQSHHSPHISVYAYHLFHSL